MALEFSALPFRAYNLIYNEWFRSQDLQDSVPVPKGDGPDSYELYQLLRRGKRHDYFTSALPWPQKGSAVTLPLGERAPVAGIGVDEDVMLDESSTSDWRTAFGNQEWPLPPGPLETFYHRAGAGTAPGQIAIALRLQTLDGEPGMFPDIYADLTEAASVTVNQLRQSFQIQRLLERNARGGTRYTELLKAHFGVSSPDQRLQRPEYLGGGSVPVVISPLATTTEDSRPLGDLAGIATAISNGQGFSQSFTEHGFIIGLAMVRADLNYQQGLHRMWSRRTRYDHYFPAFAHLGEQAVLRKEIYAVGDDDDPDGDGAVFGYQERWAELRYGHSKITGAFRSTYGQTLDAWHLAQEFDNAPTLSSDFIVEDPPMERVLAIGELGSQFLFDSFFDVRSVRPLPTYSVPGLIDHF